MIGTNRVSKPTSCSTLCDFYRIPLVRIPCLTILTSTDLVLKSPSHTDSTESSAADLDPVPDRAQSPERRLTPEVPEHSSTPSLPTADEDEPPSRRSHFDSTPSTPQHSPSSTPEPLRIFPSPLRREIDSQPHATAEERRAKLIRMTDYEFSRACNIARNRELMAETFGPGMIASDFRRGRNKSSGKPTGNQVSCDNVRRSSRSVDEENADETIVSSHPCTDESQTEIRAPSPDPDPVQCPEDPVVEAQTAPSSRAPQDDVTNSAELSRSQPPVGPKPTSLPAVNRTSWPQWLAEKYDFYAELEFGADWNECIYIWTELERAFEFRSTVSFFI